MNLNIDILVLMTSNPITVNEKTIMTEVATLFESNEIHHIPVVTGDMKVLGVISHRDYCQLQHHFTRLGSQVANDYNDRFFSALTAKDVMTPNPITLKKTEKIVKAMDLFLENKYQSIVVTEDDKCVGIVTTQDILSYFRKYLP